MDLGTLLEMGPPEWGSLQRQSVRGVRSWVEMERSSPESGSPLGCLLGQGVPWAAHPCPLGPSRPPLPAVAGPGRPDAVTAGPAPLRSAPPAPTRRRRRGARGFSRPPAPASPQPPAAASLLPPRGRSCGGRHGRFGPDPPPEAAGTRRPGKGDGCGGPGTPRGGARQEEAGELAPRVCPGAPSGGRASSRLAGDPAP